MTWAISKSRFCKELEVSLAKNEQSDKDDKHPFESEEGDATVNTCHMPHGNYLRKQKE